jgi:hypothetical protein
MKRVCYKPKINGQMVEKQNNVRIKMYQLRLNQRHEEPYKNKLRGP